MRILITGGTGFIGACLARHLSKDNDVHLVHRPSANTWRLTGVRYTPHHADLAVYASVERAVSKIKPEKIFHLAGYGVYPTQTDISTIFQSNVQGTVNLLKAVKKTGFRSFVFSGSGFEYGLVDKPITESNELRPPDPYSLSKAAASSFLIDEAVALDLPINIARFFLVYGYYEASTRLIPTLINSYAAGQSPQLASKKNVRDFVFVDDVVDAVVKISDSGLAGEAFNIGSGKEHSVEQVAETVRKLFDSRLMPTWGVAQKRTFEPKHWCADISKAKRILGWEPKYSLEEGLKKMIEWHRVDNREKP